MKLEDQVCSLELAKKLKSLNVKQESLFYWGISEFERDEPQLTEYRNQQEFDSENEFSKFWGMWSCSEVEIGSYKETYSAFTVAELLHHLQLVAKRDIIIAVNNKDVANTLANQLVEYYAQKIQI